MSLRDRLRRFERLERPRKAGAEGDARPGTDGRFGTLDGASAPPAPPASSASGATGERFAPPPPRAPDLELRSDEEQPFVRCMRCETDGSRYATTCTTCGEDLQTEAQQDYNRRLWAARVEERQALDRENAERRQAQAQAEADAAEARRLAAIEMAREVGERERWRLEREEGGWSGGPLGGEPWGGERLDPTPLGLRLWRAIQSPTWRLVAVGALLALVGAGLGLSRRFPPALFLVVGLLALLFLPRRRYRRRLWW